MILSIRHRILLPFLLITIFMAFSAMLICTELINGYFDHQLENKAQTITMPIENSFHQMASKTFLEFSTNDDSLSFDQILQHANLQSQFALTFINNRFFLYEPSTTSLSLIPFSFRSINFPNNLRNIYIQVDNQIFNIKNLSTPLSISNAQSFKDITKNGERHRRFFRQHPLIDHLYFDVDINSHLIEKKRNLTLGFVVVGLFLVNIFIIIIFSIILKHITRSLTEMTMAAKKITNGQVITPMKVKSNDEFGLLAQSFNNMLNSVQTKTAELIYEKNRSKMILAQLPDGIIVTDLNHKLLMANRAAENMLGFSTDCAKGQELIQYLKDENLYSLFSDELKQIESNQLIREVTIKDGKDVEQSYQITISPLMDSTYQKTGLITVIRNITQQNQMRYLKDSFLRSVTHELKTPLTSIIGFLNILKKEMHGNLNEKQKEFLTITLLNTSILKKLINNLLELSIIHSGQLALNKRSICINDLIQDLVHESLPIIEKKKNFILVDMQEQNMQIYADQDKLYQLIQNLILNANKYTNDGKIECIVSQTSAFVSIVIKDDGSGLTTEQKQTLCKAFKETANNEFSFNEAIGIELAIVKELVRLHDGEIHIESELEQGSSFTINIPQQSAIDVLPAKHHDQTSLDYTSVSS